LQQIGRSGYVKMINEDIEISKHFFAEAKKHAELEAVTQNLSITTLRYIPEGYLQIVNPDAAYLNTLNEKLLNALQVEGKHFCRMPLCLESTVYADAL
jgi:aromatic-L-amino-acid/L-tryptophan decarboxylase